MRKIPINYICVSVFTANILCFVTGTTSTWTSPELPKLNSTDTSPFGRPITTEEASWIASLLAIGAMVGPFIFGFLIDSIGRKWTLLACGVPLVISHLMLAFGKNVVLFYIARALSGISLAGMYTMVPLYFGEIAHQSNRGAIGASLGTFFGSGQLFCYLMGPYVDFVIFNVILATISAIFLLLFFLFGVESPHYLIIKKKHSLAKSALIKLRSNDNKNTEIELSDIQAYIERDAESHGTFLDIFRSKGLIRALLISVGLSVFGQLSGINAIMSYAQSIFDQSGTSLDSAVCSIIIGSVNLGGNLVAPLLSDRVGRKTLLILSSIGITVAEVPLVVYGYLKDNGTDVSTVSFIPLICLILYLFAFNSAYSSLPFVLLGEMFPAHVKTIASSISLEVSGILSFFVIKYFPVLTETVGMGSAYLIFTCFSIASIPFCIFCLFETKGKSFEEIQDILNNKKK